MRLDRRTLLLGATAGAAVPFVRPAAEPDELFLAGQFDAADRGYARVLEAGTATSPRPGSWRR